MKSDCIKIIKCQECGREEVEEEQPTSLKAWAVIGRWTEWKGESVMLRCKKCHGIADFGPHKTRIVPIGTLAVE